jgi:hypothetical protein
MLKIIRNEENKMAKKTIITAAVTGAWPKKREQPKRSYDSFRDR